MQFSKAEKILHQTNSYNPPPGYYSSDFVGGKSLNSNNYRFSKEQRFVVKQVSQSPGPGSYYNSKAERVKKRLLEQAKKKQIQQKATNAGQSQIKISSIPSIPKKSTTRVYQELAPGILILHEEQNQAANVGPGSYNINYEFGQKKVIAHKINPQHKQKVEPPPFQVKIPTIAEQIRNEKRQLYKKQVIKASNVNKNMISPSDLCLQVIILREKLLRAEQNPAPGQYYNQKYQSSFKQTDPDLLPQYQLMMGKQTRFKGQQQSQVGPGAYEIKPSIQKQGGFIPKKQRQLNNLSTDMRNLPGPGAYCVERVNKQIVNPKGNYPPIFGSGSNRFYFSASKINENPGPGSYKIDCHKKKKQKYIKIKRQIYESQVVKGKNDQTTTTQLFSLNGDKSKMEQQSRIRASRQKRNHYFDSKVQRFTIQNVNQNTVGPGNYDIGSLSLIKKSYNRNQNSYVGSKNARFDQTVVRPHLGPGTYHKAA